MMQRQLIGNLKLPMAEVTLLPLVPFVRVGPVSLQMPIVGLGLSRLI
jgi:hypothetical protein